MQHKNTQNLTKKYRISAVCKHLLMIQLSKTRFYNFPLDNCPLFEYDEYYNLIR